MLTIDLDFQEFEFEKGATIDVKPLSFAAYQKVFAFLNSSGISSGKDNTANALKQMSSPELQKLYKNVFPKHCKNVKGVEIKIDGKKRPLEIDDIINEGAFIMWGISILAHLFEISSLSKQEKETVKK